MYLLRALNIVDPIYFCVCQPECIRTTTINTQTFSGKSRRCWEKECRAVGEPVPRPTPTPSILTLCSEQVKDLWVQVLFSFVLLLYLHAFFNCLFVGYFLVVIVGLHFLDDRSLYKSVQRSFCFAVLLSPTFRFSPPIGGVTTRCSILVYLNNPILRLVIFIELTWVWNLLMISSLSSLSRINGRSLIEVYVETFEMIGIHYSTNS